MANRKVYAPHAHVHARTRPAAKPVAAIYSSHSLLVGSSPVSAALQKRSGADLDCLERQFMSELQS